MNEYSLIIDEWFSSTWGGGLFLPDGWFGKPHDNIHVLESFSESNEMLILKLDKGNLELFFYGNDIEISSSRNELIFSNYEELVFNWTEYGGDTMYTNKYSNGVVKIIAPPGG